jgi:hypothetical protein
LFSSAGGVYHGKVKFPEEYPFKPPGIRFSSDHLFLVTMLLDSPSLISMKEGLFFLTGRDFVMGWAQHDYSKWAFCNK